MIGAWVVKVAILLFGLGLGLGMPLLAFQALRRCGC